MQEHIDALGDSDDELDDDAVEMKLNKIIETAMNNNNNNDNNNNNCDNNDNNKIIKTAMNSTTQAIGTTVVGEKKRTVVDANTSAGSDLDLDLEFDYNNNELVVCGSV